MGNHLDESEGPVALRLSRTPHQYLHIFNVIAKPYTYETLELFLEAGTILLFDSFREISAEHL